MWGSQHKDDGDDVAIAGDFDVEDANASRKGHVVLDMRRSSVVKGTTHWIENILNHVLLALPNYPSQSKWIASLAIIMNSEPAREQYKQDATRLHPLLRPMLS